MATINSVKFENDDLQIVQGAALPVFAPELDPRAFMRTQPLPWSSYKDVDRELEDLPPVIESSDAKGDDVTDPRLPVPPEFVHGYSNSITFYLNGKRKTIADAAPDRKVTFVRQAYGVIGPKLGCWEGGCGACTVMISKHDDSGKPVHRTVNACLRLLPTVDGMEITTAEGLGSHRKGYHPVQTRMAHGHGSQCGYCTPGFVTQMYGLLMNNPTPTSDDIEHNFSGNVCRCTGYRPIMQAFQTFSKEQSDERSDQFDASEIDNKISEGLKNYQLKPLYLRRGNRAFFRPLKLDETFELLKTYQDVPLKIVGGNTGAGVAKHYDFHKNDEPLVYIDVSKIEGFDKVTSSDTNLNFGASVTITNMVNALEKHLKSAPEQSTNFPAIIRHMKKIAGSQVRNSGTWAGNLVVAKTHEAFPSDMLVILDAINAKVTVQSADGSQTISIKDFESLELSPQQLITEVQIPLAEEGVIIDSDKVAPQENAHATVNAGFRLELDDEKLVKSASVTFGGLQDGLTRADKVQKYLEGKPLISHTLKEALKTLEDELEADEAKPDQKWVTESAAYRKNLAVNLFYKFFLSVQDHLPDELKSAAEKHERVPSSGKQVYTENPVTEPISFPISAVTGLEQASGEARYTSDLAYPRNGLWGAPVYSSRAKAVIKSIDVSSALALAGVVDVVTAKDVREIGGVNEIGAYDGDRPIFAENEVVNIGQMIALVVASSNRIARDGARRVVVDYGEPESPPILSLEEGIAKKAFLFHEDFPKYKGNFKPPRKFEKGDLEKGFEDATHVVEGELSTASQEHFYMESQSCSVFPEESRIHVFASTQGPSFTRDMLSVCLGVPSNKIIVTVRRIGGGYGGKMFAAGSLANIAACSVAAIKHTEPVRCQYNRDEDIEMTGKRLPWKCDYKVGFDDEGKIHALDFNVYAGAGSCIDRNFGPIMGFYAGIDNCYNVDNFRTSAYLCHMNLPPNTACRAPGRPTGVFFMEGVIENVAHSLGVDPRVVREKNFYVDGQRTHQMFPIENNTIRPIWGALREQSNYDELVADTERFNQENKFKKRGVAMMPAKYLINIGWGIAAVNVMIQNNDGTVMVSTGGVEMGQGLYTKVFQAISYRLGVPLDKIAISDTSTDKYANASLTGGSIGSEICTKAAINACVELNKILQPIKESLPEDATWQQIVSAAHGKALNLNATGFFAPRPHKGDVGMAYFSYSAATCQVEIDTLTGETEILSCDIVYDCGQPINPAIDIGQIEGGFIMGLGMFMLEEMKYNSNGKIQTNNTWDYELPSTATIPRKMNVTLLDDIPYEKGVMKSKASGEPSFLLASVAYFATKSAIMASRKQNGLNDYIELPAPLTPSRTQLACEVSRDELGLD